MVKLQTIENRIGVIRQKLGRRMDTTDWQESEHPRDEEGRFTYSGSGGVSGYQKHAEKMDVFIQPKLDKELGDDDKSNILRKIDDVYKEFGLDPSEDNQKLVWSISADDKLEENMATGSASKSGVVSFNTKSNYLKNNDYTNVYHEMGHMIGFALERVMKKRFSDTDAIYNRIVHEGYQDFSKKNKDMTKEKAIGTISNYSLHSNKEAIADAVRDYMVNHDKAKEMSKCVVGRLKKYVDKYIKAKK